MSELVAGLPYFSWTSDQNGDGVPEWLAYETTDWLPNIDPPDGGRKIRSAVYDTLSGDALVLMAGRPDRHDQRFPGQFELSWSVVEERLALTAQEDYAAGQLVSVRLDHHWRQLRVWATASGVLVDGGALDYEGDTYYNIQPVAITSYTLGNGTPNTARAIVATPANGGMSITVQSGALSAGMVALATLPDTGNLPPQTGIVWSDDAANARLCRVIGYTPSIVGAGLVGLKITLQEVRSAA